MTPRQKELARHALGLTRKRCSYRNAFIAGNNHKDYADWMQMVEAGEATRRDVSTLPFSGDHIFRLTLSGAQRALEPGEVLDTEYFPQVSDKQYPRG